MTRKLLIFTAICMVLACGCTKRKAPEDEKANVPPAIPLVPGAQTQVPQQATDQFPTDPNAVLAQVEGAKLTVSEANDQIRIRISASGRRMSPGQFRMMRPILMLQVVDQFVAQILLAKEANKQKIEVTEEDEKEALEKIRAGLPEGVNLEEAMAESRHGKERLMEDLRNSIRIKKLLTPVTEKEVEVKPEEISRFREQNKARLKVPERIDARHILVKVEATDDENVRAEKKKAIEDIKKQLDEGADFAELASKHSDCGTSANGGKLETFGRGDMVPKFEEAALTQKVGVIGPVVETRFGYHIIKVEKREGGGEITNEKIVEILTQGKREMELTKYLNTLRADAKVITHPGLDAMAARARNNAAARRNTVPPMPPPQAQ